jgi:hypothetical protein
MGETTDRVPEASCAVPTYERESLDTPPQDRYEFVEEVDDGSGRNGHKTGR